MRSVRVRLGLLTLALAAVFVVGASALRTLQGRRAEQIARQSAQRSTAMASIDRLTGLDRAKFANFIVDYTWWDELAHYVTRPDARWAIDNLDSSFDAVKADGIWVYDRSLRMVYGKTSRSSRLPSTLPFPSSVFTALLSKDAFASFWVRTSRGIAEVRIGRIHFSNDPNRTGPFTGYLAGIHLWTTSDAKQLAELVQARVELRPYRQGDPADSSLQSYGDGRFVVRVPLKDYLNNGTALLQLSGVSEEARALLEADTRERWTLGVYAVALYALVVLAINLWVARPLRAISAALAQQSDAPVAPLIGDKGEFGQIAHTFRAFLEQKRQLEEETRRRKEAMEALEASEQRLQGILDTVQSGILVVDAETHVVVDANPAMLAIAGVSREELVGQVCHKYVCPSEEGSCPITDLHMDVDNAERVVVRRDGTEVPVLKSVKSVQLAGKRFLIESMTDISNLKRVQQELAESQKRYLEFFTLNPVPCWVYDVETLRFVDVNEAALRHYGYTRSEFLNLTVPEIRPVEDVEAYRSELAAATGVRYRQAVRYHTKDGRKLDVDTTSIPIVVDGRACRLVVAYDVTERVAAEAKAAAFQKELERSNRELQDFASVASHDLQEPLRKISAFAGRIEKRFGDAMPPEAKEYLERMLSAVTRMQTLIEDLLTYSRVTTRAKPFQPLDLNTVLQEVLGDLEARLQVSGGRVEVGPLPTIEADPTQMRQLFQNLIGNALKFRRPDVPPVVEVFGETITVDGRPWCKLIIRDNGIGFDNQYAERIFGVFERLHGREEYEGTGMGLAIVRKLVTRHGGTITAEGRPGEGATFTILLPATHPEHQDAQPAA